MANVTENQISSTTSTPTLRCSNKANLGLLLPSGDDLSNGHLLKQNVNVGVGVKIPSYNSEFVFDVDPSTTIDDLCKRVISCVKMPKLKAMNYGLYWPAKNGRRGKFLQEERAVCEYAFLIESSNTALMNHNGAAHNGSSGVIKDNFLELVQKQRYMENCPFSEEKFRKVNSKSVQRQFLEMVRSGAVERVQKWLDRGLDPNFQDLPVGKTPLTTAVALPHPKSMIVALFGGGAHLAFRDSQSFTPLHRAAISGNVRAMKTLLELGQNPNCRDGDELTPLYHAVSKFTAAQCTQLLLYDHAVLGVVDSKGRQEIHQACYSGCSQHLDQLVTYGADLDAQTNHGDTPLHVCVIADQESCLRLLLFRGANRSITNNEGQTPLALALLTEKKGLADLLRQFSDVDVVRVTGQPEYNTSRRPLLHGPRAAAQLRQSRQTSFRDTSSVTSRDGSDFSTSPTTRAKTASPVSLLDFDRFARSVPELSERVAVDSVADIDYRLSSYKPSERNLLPDTFQELRISDRDKSTRTVTLQRGTSGFGFVLVGPKARSFSTTGEVLQQKLSDVQTGGPADKAGLLSGDLLIAVNGIDVSDSPHSEVVDRISSSGSSLTLTVLTPSNKQRSEYYSTAVWSPSQSPFGFNRGYSPHQRTSVTPSHSQSQYDLPSWNHYRAHSTEPMRRYKSREAWAASRKELGYAQLQMAQQMSKSSSVGQRPRDEGQGFTQRKPLSEDTFTTPVKSEQKYVDLAPVVSREPEEAKSNESTHSDISSILSNGEISRL